MQTYVLNIVDFASDVAKIAQLFKTEENARKVCYAVSVSICAIRRIPIDKDLQIRSDDRLNSKKKNVKDAPNRKAKLKGDEKRM